MSELLEQLPREFVTPTPQPRRRRWVLIAALAVLSVAGILLTIAISPFASAAGVCGGG